MTISKNGVAILILIFSLFGIDLGEENAGKRRVGIQFIITN
jgi:hypothetical protein